MDDIIIIMAIPLAISFILSFFITPRMRIVSYHGSSFIRKRKDDMIGMEIGGLSLYPIVLISMCITISLPNLIGIEELRHQVEPATMRILQIIVGCTLLYIMGVKDDFH